MVFFDASDAFVQWLGGHADGRVIIDCGCGDGDLLKKLIRRRIKAFGIEPFWFMRSADLTLPVLPMSVQRCAIVKTSPHLIVIARPDHGGWTSWVCHHAHVDSEILYIGKSENLETDLGDWKTNVLRAPDCDLEKVYQVDRRERVEPTTGEKIHWEMMDLVGV